MSGYSAFVRGSRVSRSNYNRSKCNTGCAPTSYSRHNNDYQKNSNVYDYNDGNGRNHNNYRSGNQMSGSRNSYNPPNPSSNHLQNYQHSQRMRNQSSTQYSSSNRFGRTNYTRGSRSRQTTNQTSYPKASHHQPSHQTSRQTSHQTSRQTSRQTSYHTPHHPQRRSYHQQDANDYVHNRKYNNDCEDDYDDKCDIICDDKSEDHCEEKPKKKNCDKPELEVQKCLLVEANAKHEGADVKLLIFDITITNKTNKKFACISLNDSLFGLLSIIKCLKVEAVSYTESVKTLEGHQIVERDGELLDTAASYVEPCETARIILKVLAKGVASFQNSSHCAIDQVKICDLLTCYNTLIMNGKLVTSYSCGCCKREEAVDPIFCISKANCSEDRVATNKNKYKICRDVKDNSSLYELID